MAKPTSRARYMRLGPGSRVRKHSKLLAGASRMVINIGHTAPLCISRRPRSAAHLLSGLSGVITDVRWRRDDRLENKVRFRMHAIVDLRQSLTQEFVPLSNLCFLFAGLLPGPEGVLLNTQRQNPSRVSRTRRTHRRGVAILRCVESRDPTSSKIHLIRSLGLKVTNVKTLTPIHADADMADQLAAGASPELMAKYLHIGYIKPKRESDEAFDCWLLREDIYTILLAYLESPMSPQSFLYDAKEDIVLKHAVRPTAFKEILQLAQRFIDRLGIEDAERGALRLKLEQVATNDISGQGWSRTEINTLWTLDQALSKISRLKGPRSLAMSMLYMPDQSFQEGTTRFLKADAQAPLNNVLINYEQQIVRLPDAEQRTEYQDFPFNFRAVLDDTYDAEITMLTNHGALNELSFPLVDCLFACLRGHVRALMWKMSLSPVGLADFFDQLTFDSIAYVATDRDVHN
ncbi:hypothetical protein K469DRAFT_682776 [Zopfia rhizophila CBS 207.26]|uniref:Uncharacterized protein n=1 Tax=Zopfia rhizophila CBS 207.26 TaxID=1314779 RepID=A0A6A6D9G5_9PEZI|nr:hypothetical protein K469DRAFT_682776 [Zopfia rhizophila CBS 207.26]